MHSGHTAANAFVGVNPAFIGWAPPLATTELSAGVDIVGEVLPDPGSGTYVVDGNNIMLEKIITRDEFLSCAEGGSVQSPLTLQAMLLKVREYMAVQDDEGTFASPVRLHLRCLQRFRRMNRTPCGGACRT
jgi:hypothetical protein